MADYNEMTLEDAKRIAESLTDEQQTAVLKYALEGDSTEYYLKMLQLVLCSLTRYNIECNAEKCVLDCTVRNKGIKYKTELTIVTKNLENKHKQ